MQLPIRINHLLILTLLLGLSSCQTNETFESNEIQLTGQVANPAINRATLFSIYGRQTLAINDGSFQRTLKSDRPTVLNIVMGNNSLSLYARPGDHIQLEYGLEPTPRISGGLVTENQFLSSLTDSLRNKMGNPMGIYRLPEEVAIEQLATIQQYGLDLLQAFQQEEPNLNHSFVELAKQYVVYFTGTFLTEYPNYYPYAHPDAENYQPGAALQAAIDQLQAEQPNLLTLPSYIDALKAKKTAKANALMEQDSSLQASLEGYLLANQLALESEFSNPAIIDMMTYQHLSEYIEFSGTDDIEAEYASFLAEANDPYLKEELETAYSAWSHLAKGAPAPGFTYPDIESTLHSLSDYQGKVVYVDVWATWCGPCLAEQPYLAEVEAAFEGNEDIVFMGVSIDADKTAWKNMVREKEMSGVQLYAGNGPESSLPSDYLIKSIPRFLLIDADGKVVDATAIRPSNQKLQAQLEALLAD